MSKDDRREFERRHSSFSRARSPRLTSLTADLEKVQAVVEDLRRQIDEEKSRLAAEAQTLLETSGAAADRQKSDPT